MERFHVKFRGYRDTAAMLRFIIINNIDSWYMSPDLYGEKARIRGRTIALIYNLAEMEAVDQELIENNVSLRRMSVDINNDTPYAKQIFADYFKTKKSSSPAHPWISDDALLGEVDLNTHLRLDFVAKRGCPAGNAKNVYTCARFILDDGTEHPEDGGPSVYTMEPSQEYDITCSWVYRGWDGRRLWNAAVKHAEDHLRGFLTGQAYNYFTTEQGFHVFETKCPDDNVIHFLSKTILRQNPTIQYVTKDPNIGGFPQLRLSFNLDKETAMSYMRSAVDECLKILATLTI